MRSCPWLIGFATAARAGRFLVPTSERSSLRRPFETVHVSNSTVLACTPLQSSFASLLDPAPPEGTAEPHLPRFLALLATSRACVHFSARHPISPHTFRPQVFATSRRFSPHSRSRAYFIPLPRPGPSCSGCSPLAQPSLLIGRSVPPGRCSLRTHRRSGVRTPSPRLRGFHPRESALLRASVVHRRPRPLPSSGFSPPGPSFLVVHPFYSDAPLLMLPCAAFAFALAAPDHLQRLLHEKMG